MHRGDAARVDAASLSATGSLSLGSPRPGAHPPESSTRAQPHTAFLAASVARTLYPAGLYHSAAAGGDGAALALSKWLGPCCDRTGPSAGRREPEPQADLAAGCPLPPTSCGVPSPAPSRCAQWTRLAADSG